MAPPGSRRLINESVGQTSEENCVWFVLRKPIKKNGKQLVSRLNKEGYRNPIVDIDRVTIYMTVSEIERFFGVGPKRTTIAASSSYRKKNNDYVADGDGNTTSLQSLLRRLYHQRPICEL